jgi:hypothetical protein
MSINISVQCPFSIEVEQRADANKIRKLVLVRSFVRSLTHSLLIKQTQSLVVEGSSSQTIQDDIYKQACCSIELALVFSVGSLVLLLLLLFDLCISARNIVVVVVLLLGDELCW